MSQFTNNLKGALCIFAEYEYTQSVSLPKWYIVPATNISFRKCFWMKAYIISIDKLSKFVWQAIRL